MQILMNALWKMVGVITRAIIQLEALSVRADLVTHWPQMIKRAMVRCKELAL